MKAKGFNEQTVAKKFKPSELDALRKANRATIIHLGPSDVSLDQILYSRMRKARKSSATVLSRVSASKRTFESHLIKS